MPDVGRYILAFVLAAVTSAFATILVPGLAEGFGWIVQAILSVFGVFFYAETIRYALDEEILP